MAASDTIAGSSGAAKDFFSENKNKLELSMIIKQIAIIAALGICGLASNASAETVIYTGNVTSDFEYNAWGATQLTTDSFIGDAVTITFSENLANSYRPDGYASPSAFWAGGANITYNGPSPVSSGTIIVADGPSLSVPGTELGEQLNSGAFTFPLNNGGEQYSFSRAINGNIYAELSADLAGSNVPEFGNYSGPNIYSEVDGGVAFRADFTAYDAISNITSYGWMEGTLTSVTSDVTQSDIPSRVPEPSTWAIMLLGFVGLGFAGYRRARPRSGNAISRA